MNYMSLKNHVYEYISESIKDGSLRPGDKINEQHLSDKLNVSRTPVREALIQLAAEGLLDAEPRRGFRVKPPILAEVKDLYQLIGHLDAMAAPLALADITKTDLDQMRKLQSEMKDAIESQDFEKYYRLQIEFHNVYLRKCSNKQLIIMLEQLELRFIKRGYSDSDSDRLNEIFNETNAQHTKIIELFESRDARALESFLKEKHWSMDYAVLDVL